MGAWEEIRDGVTVQGFLKPEKAGEGKVVLREDGDWTFSVEPAKGFEHLLINPAGHTNSNRLIECEIEPPGDILGDDAEDVETVSKHMVTLLGEGVWATVEGTWVIDTDHSDKTEIHPITSLLIERPPAPDNRSRLIDFLVFSDDSYNVPDAVFHSDENRKGELRMPVPLGSKFGSEVKLKDEWNMSDSNDPFKVVDKDGFSMLEGTVFSGRPSEGKGFYHATIELPGFTVLTYMKRCGNEATVTLRDIMNFAGVSSVRELFRRLDTVGIAS